MFLLLTIQLFAENAEKMIGVMATRERNKADQIDQER